MVTNVNIPPVIPMITGIVDSSSELSTLEKPVDIACCLLCYTSYSKQIHRFKYVCTEHV